MALVFIGLKHVTALYSSEQIINTWTLLTLSKPSKIPVGKFLWSRPRCVTSLNVTNYTFQQNPVVDKLCASCHWHFNEGSHQLTLYRLFNFRGFVYFVSTTIMHCRTSTTPEHAHTQAKANRPLVRVPGISSGSRCSSLLPRLCSEGQGVGSASLIAVD